MTASRACPETSGSGRGVWLRALLGATMLTACAPGAGPGTDWTLDGRIGESVTVDTNPDLDRESESLVTTALNAGLLLTAEMKRALFAADLGLAGRYFLGEDDELAGTGRVDPRLAARAEYRGKTYALSGRASVETRSTRFSRFLDVDVDDGDVPDLPDEPADEFAFTEDEATQISAAVGASLARALDPRNDITFGINWRQVEFTDDVEGLTPTRTIAGTAGWQHDLSETSTLDLSVGLRDFEADDVEDRRSQALDLTAGLTHLRTPRHEFRVRGGLTGVRSVQGSETPDFELGFTGGAGLDYRLSALSAGLNVSQSVDPSLTEGELQAFTRVDGNLRYAVNSRESLAASANYARRAPLSGGGDVDHLLSLGPSYSIALTPDTRLSLGYAFRLNLDETEGTASGHRVFLSVNHAFGPW